MSDNIAAEIPDIDFVRPCNLCPHMKRITLPKIRRALETMQHEVTIDPAVAARPAAPSSACWRSVRRTPWKRSDRNWPGAPVIIGGGLAGLDDGAAPGAAARDPARQDAARAGRRLSAWAQGGVAAAVGEDDDPALHAADTLAAGDGLSDPAVAARIAAAAPSCHRRARALRRRLRPRRPGLASRWAWRPRTADAASSMSRATARGRRSCARWSRRWPPPLRSPCSRASRRAACWSTIAASRACWRRGRGAPACWRPVASCSPPAGWAGSTPHDQSAGRHRRGPGAGRPRRRGAADMEFVQFHPTALAVGLDPMPLVSEAVRGEGAMLVDETGSDSWRGVRRRRARAARRRLARRGRAHRRRPPRLPRCPRGAGRRASRAHFPGIARAAGRPASIRAIQPIPVRPAAHYHMGGIAVDGDGPQHASTACGRAARWRRRACTAPTGWPAIRCSRRW